MLYRKSFEPKRLFLLLLLLFLPGPLTTAIVKTGCYLCLCKLFAFKIFYIFSFDSAVGGKSAFVPKNKQLLLQNSDSVFFLNGYYSDSTILCHSRDLFFWVKLGSILKKTEVANSGIQMLNRFHWYLTLWNAALCMQLDFLAIYIYEI